MLKKRIALILAAALTLTSVPLTERTVNAEILPEIAADAEITSEADILYHHIMDNILISN